MSDKHHRFTVPANAAGPARFDPSTWAQQAKLLAHHQAEAHAWWAAITAASAVGLSAAAMYWSNIEWDQALIPLLAFGITASIIVLVVYIISYSRALNANTISVKRATWGEEERQGVDLDGDGRVGPPVGHVVRINGPKPAEVVLPDLDGSRADRRPLVEFPVSPNDVIYILTRAQREGLGNREWEGHTLPSGETVRRNTLNEILDGMAAWQFTIERRDAAGRRHARLRADVSVETMIAAVQTSVRAAEKP